MSSMHIALADFVGVTDRITGLGSFDYIVPGGEEECKGGQDHQVGLDGNLNNELIISMHPAC